MTLTNITTLVNSGTDAPDLDAELDIGTDQGPMYIGPKLVVGEGPKRLVGQFDGTNTYLPVSREELYQNAVLLYAEADKTPGTSWGNTGSLGVTGDLTYNNTPIQDDHFDIPGTTGNYLSVPDSAALDLTTAIEVVVRVSSAKWHNRSGNQRIVAKRGAAGASSYEVFIGYDSQMGKIGFTPNQTTIAYSPVPVPFANGETGWIKVTYTNSGGVLFYCAPDSTTEPSTWYQLGAVQSLGVTMAANTHLLYLGGLGALGADFLDGRLYNVIIRSSIGGSVVFNMDVPTDTAAMTPGVTTTFTATSGQTVTLSSAANVMLTRTAYSSLIPYYEVAFDAAMFGGANETTVMWAVVDAPTPDNALHAFQVLGFFGGLSARVVLLHGTSNDNVYTTAYDGAASQMLGSILSNTGFTASTTERYCLILYMEHQSGVLNLRPAMYRETTEDLVKNSTYDLFNNTFSATPTFDFFRVAALDDANYEVIEAGVAVLPTISGIVSTEPDIDKLVESWGRAAFDQEPAYVLGDTWIITDAGSLVGGVGLTVAEGDLIYVSSVGPTVWDSIAISGRDPVLYAVNDKWESNITPPSDIVIGPTDDVFMWAMISGGSVFGNTYTDIFEMTGFALDGYIWFGYYPPAGELDIEFDDDLGNFIYEYYVALPVIGSLGLDTPLLFTAWLDRSDDTVSIYVVYEGIGYMIASGIDASAIGTITLDGAQMSGSCDLAGGLCCWGRGFTYGSGIIPPLYAINDLYTLLIGESPL